MREGGFKWSREFCILNFPKLEGDLFCFQLKEGFLQVYFFPTEAGYRANLCSPFFQASSKSMKLNEILIEVLEFYVVSIYHCIIFTLGRIENETF